MGKLWKMRLKPESNDTSVIINKRKNNAHLK